jgi:hypothetical protein
MVNYLTVAISDAYSIRRLLMTHNSAPPFITGAGSIVPQASKPAVTLNPNDPFEKQLISIVETNRRKRKDYALDGDPFSNFRMTSELLGIPGFGATEAALFNVIQKLIRLHSLRKNGRIHDTANESVADTYLDAAVYAVITFAIEMERLDPNRVHCED